MHRPGERLFLDYSGKKQRIADAETGELIEVELFVGVLGATVSGNQSRVRRRRFDRVGNQSCLCR